MKAIQTTGNRQTHLSSTPAPRVSSTGEGGLERLREIVGTVVYQNRDVALGPNSDFGQGQGSSNPGIGHFLGETRYFSQDGRGELGPVRQYPRNAEEAQQFQVDRGSLFATNQRLRRVRNEIQAFLRKDNGPTDLNPELGVVVENGWFGPPNRRGSIPSSRSLTYDRNGNVNYESRKGRPGSSRIESYQGSFSQFRYLSGNEGQMPDRVIETNSDGLVRSWRSEYARD